MRVSHLRAVVLAAVAAGCRLAPAAALQDPAVRGEVAGRLLSTLDAQRHYFPDSRRRDLFERRLQEVARTSRDAREFYDGLARALATLDEGHTGLSGSPEVPVGDAVPPVALLEVDGAPVVAGVAPGVEGGGLRPGDEILSIDGVSARDALEAQLARAAGSTPHGRRARGLANLLSGPMDRPARVAARGPDGRTRMAYPLRFLLDDEGHDRFRFGFLRGEVVATRLDLATAYVALPDFQEARVEAFARTLRGLGPCAALVLDLRGNPGGRIRAMQTVAGHFVEDARPLLRYREGGREDVVAATPASPRFRGRLAIVVDGRTGSAAELLAAALRDAGRARIYGTATAGSARTRHTALLPGGVEFHFAAEAEFFRLDGTPVEGVGVAPDVPVHVTRRELAEGVYGDPHRDPAVRAAAAGVD